MFELKMTIIIFVGDCLAFMRTHRSLKDNTINFCTKYIYYICSKNIYIENNQSILNGTDW